MFMQMIVEKVEESHVFWEMKTRQKEATKIVGGKVFKLQSFYSYVQTLRL